MIKKFFSLSALLLVLAACTNDIDYANRPMLQDVVFYATIEDGSDAETKVFADGQMRVLWNADDRITIYNKDTYGEQYYFTGNDGANAGGFKKIQSDDEFTTGNPLSYIYAVYPYSPANDIDYDGVLTLNLPSEQTYKERSFGIGANTMVSVSSDTRLKFRNVGGYLSFKFYGEGISVKSITLKGNNHEKLAGAAKVTMPVDGLPIVAMQNTATESITLTCDTPVALGTSADDYTEFWFVIPPVSFTKGFTVTITDELGHAFEKSTSNAISLERNNLTRMSPIEVVFEYLPANNEIWYTSTNNNVVVPFAGCDWISGGKIVSNTYADGKGVIVFSSDITEIPSSAFRNSMPAGPLTSITLPNSVTQIKTNAFYNNAALENIYNCEHLTSIGDYAFYHCNSLQSFTIPASLTSLGVNVFTDCSSLEELTVKSTSTFHEYGLAYLVKGANIRTLKGPYATNDHKFVIINNELVMAAGKESGNIIIPDGVMTVKPYVFYSFKNARTITVPSSVSSFGVYSFYGCTGLEIINLQSQTPASVAASFDNTNECPIIVPSGSVNSYKEAWSNYSTRIAASVDELPIYLSSSGTANSYLVNNAGNYSIKASHKGNSTNDGDAINGSQAIVLWESQFGYDTYVFDPDRDDNIRVFHPFHDVGSVVTDVYYQEHKIFFTATGNEGNALIALTSNNGAVIWSWHIWVRKNVEEITCPNGKVIMSCNLGAIGDDVYREKVTSTYPYYWGEKGLLYQWGRKDPFVGNDTSLWTTETLNGYLYNYAQSHPTTYLVPISSEYTLGGWSSSEKMITDPCPPGWRIPSSNCWLMSDSDYLTGYGQYDYSGNIFVIDEYKDWGYSRWCFLNPYIYNNYYSQPGYITDSGLIDYNFTGRYWCDDSYSAGFFQLSTTGYTEDVDAIKYLGVGSGVSCRHYAQSVRCCKE